METVYKILLMTAACAGSLAALTESKFEQTYIKSKVQVLHKINNIWNNYFVFYSQMCMQCCSNNLKICCRDWEKTPQNVALYCEPFLVLHVSSKYRCTK